MSLKELEALLERRLTPEEVAEVRAIADRTAERAALNVRFAASLAAFRAANPAAVSPKWGFA